jgi:hypothetical protein
LWKKSTYKKRNKQEFIIVGHSRNISNNHLDVLKIINESQNESPYQTKMFLSYGYQNDYYRKVVEEIDKNLTIQKITDYLPSDEFEKVYNEVSALVINSHRQMGLANIIMAIGTNCKIYLNNKNPTKKWLEREGIKVFSIEEFKKDYETNNFKLSEADAEHNINVLNGMYNSYDEKDFQKKILKIIEK